MISAQSDKTYLLGIVAASLSSHRGAVAGQQNSLKLANPFDTSKTL